MGTQLERLNRLDVDRLNNTMNRLLKVEESLLSLARLLEVGALKSTTSILAPTKSSRDERISEYEASRSGHNQIGVGGDDPLGLINRHDREVLPRKLELLVFVGDDPEGWLFRVERYFEINRLTPTKKLCAVVVCLEGETLASYYYEDGRRGFRGWSEFREMIFERFRTLQAGTLLDQFFSLRQTDLVQEFWR